MSALERGVDASAGASTVTITPITPDLFDAVDELILHAYEHDYGPREGSGDDFARSRVRVARGFDVWVARDRSGRPVGSVTTPGAAGQKLMEDSRPDEFDFRLLGVAADVRHRGVGTALTAHVVHTAAERGFAAVFLKSAPHMLGAHALYTALGFARDPDRDGLILDGRKVFDLLAFRRAVPGAASPADQVASDRARADPLPTSRVEHDS